MAKVVKQFKGWLNSNNMQNPEWIEAWRDVTLHQEAQGRDMVVFSIPGDKPGKVKDNLIQEIQDLIEKYER